MYFLEKENQGEKVTKLKRLRHVSKFSSKTRNSSEHKIIEDERKEVKASACNNIFLEVREWTNKEPNGLKIEDQKYVEHVNNELIKKEIESTQTTNRSV